MPTAHTTTIDHLRRSGEGCLCCGKSDLRAETTVISPFLAQRAMGAAPSLTRVLFCANCGLRFFDRGLSDDEAMRYYQGYRSEDYCTARNYYEPFYTPRVHRKLADWLASGQRRQALAEALSGGGSIGNFSSILDYGGGDGTLIADLDAGERAVLDPSGAQPVAGVSRITEEACSEREWDLIVCAQVLEHLTDPRRAVEKLGGLLAPDGHLYLEVPDEIWENRSFAGALRDRWLGWLVRRPKLLLAGDILSTACRIRLGILPPLGFIPMREHLQYFTEQSLRAIIHASGLHVVSSGRNSAGQIYAVATLHPHIAT